MEDASVSEKSSRRRKTRSLRREIAALRRLVRDAAQLPRRRTDHRRFRKFPRFAAAERHSPGDKERNAGGGNDIRRAEGGRHLVENAKRVSEKNRAKLHQERAVASQEFSPVLPARNARRILSYRVPANYRRARVARREPPP